MPGVSHLHPDSLIESDGVLGSLEADTTIPESSGHLSVEEKQVRLGMLQEALSIIGEITREQRLQQIMLRYQLRFMIFVG